MSFLARLFAKKPASREALRSLWHRVVELAREPEFYAELGVADTVEGRFDMITAVLAMVLLRMERKPEMVPASVLLTELFVEDMDGQMRQSGVGDVVVGKHMGKLMGTMGGRLGAYRGALEDVADEGADKGALVGAVERNVSFNENGNAQRVADCLRDLAGRLDRTDDDNLLQGRIAA